MLSCAGWSWELGLSPKHGSWLNLIECFFCWHKPSRTVRARASLAYRNGFIVGCSKTLVCRLYSRFRWC